MTTRAYTEYAKDAALLLGEQIKLHRKRLKWSEAALAERAGISRATLQKIERGDMGCAVGLYFEAAALVGLPLFDLGATSMAASISQMQDKIALLPQRIKQKNREVKDDF